MSIKEIADPSEGRVVVAQIHNGCCALWLLKLYATDSGQLNLFSQFNPGGQGQDFVNTPKTELFPIDSNYQLDTPFEFEILADNGRISTKFNGVDVGAMDIDIETCYFKIGAYSQNARGDLPDDRVSHVALFNLDVTHSS